MDARTFKKSTNLLGPNMLKIYRNSTVGWSSKMGVKI